MDAWHFITAGGGLHVPHFTCTTGIDEDMFVTFVLFVAFKDTIGVVVIVEFDAFVILVVLLLVVFIASLETVETEAFTFIDDVFAIGAFKLDIFTTFTISFCLGVTAAT